MLFRGISYIMNDMVRDLYVLGMGMFRKKVKL